MTSEALQKRFRQDTKSLHSVLDQQDILSVFKGKSTSGADYLKALETLYKPHRHLEQLVAKFISEHGLNYEYQVRYDLLKQDIVSLNPESSALKTELELKPETESSITLFDVLGYLYVLEGSKLGSQYISAMINKQFAGKQPTAFLDQAELKPLNLDRFWQFMADSLRTEEHIEAAINAAKEAFQFYIELLGNNDTKL